MLDAAALIEKHHGKGVLVDTNLLVLLLVGTVGRRHIEKFKRTQGFTPEDFDILSSLVSWFGPRLVTTPHVLSQVSDLTDLPGKERHPIRTLLRSYIEIVEERYDTARVLAAHPLFERLGLTDAAIATVCARETLILTADLELALALQNRGIDALNFNHVRQLGWK
jgi:hypothetical protein